MSKPAILLITFWALVLIIGTFGCVVEAEAPTLRYTPEPTVAPASTPLLMTEPLPTLEPTPPLEQQPAEAPIISPTPASLPILVSTHTVEERSASDEVYIHYEEQPPYARTVGSHDRIQLLNNENAADPTLQQLESFLLSDETDRKDYVPGMFMCGAFAEDLHNNAEAAGIRAAWVTVSFEGEDTGHALNAFHTTDKGLIYVDCGGEEAQKYGNTQDVGPDSEPSGELMVYGGATGWDKVAYVMVGEEYGLISLDVVSCPQYICYEDYKLRKSDFEAALDDYNRKAEQYNTEVAEFNAWAAGKVFLKGNIEAERIGRWREELVKERDRLDMLAKALDEEGKSLGAFWEPLGTVSKIEIYW